MNLLVIDSDYSHVKIDLRGPTDLWYNWHPKMHKEGKGLYLVRGILTCILAVASTEPSEKHLALSGWLGLKTFLEESQ